MLTRVSPYALGIGAQKACSFLRPMLRIRLMPQRWTSRSGKRSVIIGMTISADQPSSVRRARTSQIASQSRLTLEVTPPRPPSPSLKTCWSSLAPRGLVTNMYPDRESMKVSRMIWKLSSSRMRGESLRISVALTASGLESSACTPM